MAEESEKKGGGRRQMKVPKNLIGIQRQLVEFQKSMFDSTFDAIVGFQDRQEELFNEMVEKSQMLPDEGKQIVREWIETYKKSREDFRDTVESSYNLVDDYFDRLEEESEEEQT